MPFKDPIKRKAYEKQWRLSHPEKGKSYRDDWKKANGEKAKEIEKKYLKNNPWNMYHASAQQRCQNKKHDSYKNYGEKGIEFHLKRHETKFLYIRDHADQMIKPSLDRLDSKKHYTFDNCRFIEFKENVSRRKN
jgi:hypothetical protein